MRSAIYEPKVDHLCIKSISKTYSFDTNASRDICCSEIIKIIKTENQDTVKNILNDIDNSIGCDMRIYIDKKYETEDLMSWDEVKEITNYNCTIASHTCDHAILHGKQTLETINYQLKDSKLLIERKIDKKCDYFAFPNGDISSVCSESLNQILNYYKMGFAVNGKFASYNDSLNYVSRIGMCEGFGAFKFLLSIMPFVRR